MKIAYLYSNWHLKDFTGQPAVVEQLIRHCELSGNMVFLISNCPRQNLPDVMNTSYCLVPGLSKWATYGSNFFRILKFLRRINPDLIHAHGPLMIIFAQILASLLRIPLVCSICETVEAVGKTGEAVLSLVLKKVELSTKEHPNFKKEIDYPRETGFRYKFRHPDDINREVFVTVLVIEIPK